MLGEALRTVYRLRRALKLGGIRAGLLANPTAPVNIRSDGEDWALDRMAKGIARHLNRWAAGRVAIVPGVGELIGGVVHFSSRRLWLVERRKLPRGNRSVVTFLHGVPEQQESVKDELAAFLDVADEVDAIVTSCRVIERRLIDWGIGRDRISVIPLGVDTSLCVPPTTDQRLAAREALGVADGQLCIGSFQKDGIGWGAGNEPKLVKGPDLFVAAVRRLAKDFPVKVVLTGPARGYVVEALERARVPFVHRNNGSFEDVVRCYHALDLYLVTSRDEGGPLALPEGMACGVPLVSTPVGMAPDMIRHGENGFLANAEDPESIAAWAASVLGDKDLSRRLVEEGLRTVRDYDWSVIAESHDRLVYGPLLDSLGRRE